MKPYLHKVGPEHWDTTDGRYLVRRFEYTEWRGGRSHPERRWLLGEVKPATGVQGGLYEDLGFVCEQLRGRGYDVAALAGEVTR